MSEEIKHKQQAVIMKKPSLVDNFFVLLLIIINTCSGCGESNTTNSALSAQVSNVTVAKDIFPIQLKPCMK